MSNLAQSNRRPVSEEPSAPGADGKFKIPLPAALAEAHAEIRVIYPGGKRLRPAVALVTP